MSITYKPILSNMQVKCNGYLVLQHNHVLLNERNILVLGEQKLGLSLEEYATTFKVLYFEYFDILTPH